MKAIVAHAAKDLRIEEREMPKPGAHQVLIKLAAGGICGSDLHYYNHGGFGTVRLREPMILGHEVSGHVVERGARVTSLALDELVAVSPSRPCHACTYCHEGKPHHCLNMRFYGSAMPFPHIQGAFREYIVADAVQCASAKGLSAAQAAVAEPLAVCLHAARQAGDLIGKRVLVTGCGPIGMLCILVARAAGATEVVATDMTPFTLEKAHDLGADLALNMAHDPDGLGRFTDGKGHFDVQFECSGAVAALRASIPALRPGATLVQLGLGGDMNLPVQAMTAREIAFKGSFRFHEEFFTAVKLMQTGQIDVTPLVTHAFAMDDAIAAFEMAADRTQAIKAQITF
jgi:L-idonate 5-dehydrogenase